MQDKPQSLVQVIHWKLYIRMFLTLHIRLYPIKNLLWTSVHLSMECTLFVCQSITRLSAILSSFSLLQKGVRIIRLHILYICHTEIAHSRPRF